MATETVTSDKGIGLTLAFGVLAVVSAGVMLFGGSQAIIAWGFAAAMVTAALAVVAVQLFDT
ncbi:MAG: hypothetical protein ABEH80_03340 [Halobaculum sp.]